MKKRIPHLLIQGVLIAGLTTGLVFAQQKSSVARIKIDTDRTIGQIDKMIYGNFIEHLGRCIEGGVFQEGSPLSDANGYRKDVFADALRATVINPNESAVGDLFPSNGPSHDAEVQFVTRYAIPKATIDALTYFLNDISPRSVAAMKSFIHVPDLF